MTGMADFWDERAREDAFYFVDNRINYKDPDEAARFWDMGRTDLNWILGELDLTLGSEDVVVEIGCGVGRLTRVIAERVASVKALDVSAQMLELAQRENPALTHVEWIRGDGVSLAGVDDASADVVISHVVFQHIPDPQITLGYVREIGRVLRPDGVTALVMSNLPSVHKRSASIVERVRALARRGPGGQTHEAWLGSAVELDDLREAAADGGMVIEQYVGGGTQFMLVRLRRL